MCQIAGLWFPGGEPKQCVGTCQCWYVHFAEEYGMCGAWREDTSSLALLNPSLGPPLQACIGLPPAGLHKHWEHSPQLRLSWNCLEPGQVNRDFARLRIPPRFPSPGRSPVFPSAKAPTHRPQRGLWKRPGQAHAWGCQGREKGLGLNDNQLPDCNDFIPYLLLSAIQSLSYFYPAKAARSFLQWPFK